MQAIQTKYLGPTNNLGSRVKAKCSAGSLTVGWNYALNASENHAAAARALILKLHWHRNHLREDGTGEGDARPAWYAGGLDSGERVYVCAWDDDKLADVSQEPAKPYKRVTVPEALSWTSVVA